MSNQDDFLYSLRENPGEGFTRSLYEQLLNNDELKGRKYRNLFATASIIAASFILVGAISIPGVRAAVLSSLEKIKIAGIQFVETTEYPGDESVTTIPSTTMTLDYAQDKFGFSLPEWTPEEYVLDNTVRVVEMDGSTKSVTISWRNPGKAAIHLEVLPNEYTTIVGPESVRNIELDGRNVALWRGGWNFDEKKWDDAIGAITLSWSDDGITAFHLSGMEDAVSVDDLIKMVESIP